MPNAETRRNEKIRRSKGRQRFPVVRTLSFGLLSDFGLRISDLKRFLDELEQIRIGLDRFELRKLLPDMARRAEQDADVGLLEHRGVVVRVAGGDDVVVHI